MGHPTGEEQRLQRLGQMQMEKRPLCNKRQWTDKGPSPPRKSAWPPSDRSRLAHVVESVLEVPSRE